MALTVSGRCQSEQGDGREGEREGSTERWTARDQEIWQKVEVRKASTKIEVTRLAGVADLISVYHQIRFALQGVGEHGCALFKVSM